MYESQLFEDKRIPQVQAVTYVHDWKWQNGDGGEFLWYNKGIGYEPIKIPPISRSALLVDGSTTVHGTTIFKPQKSFPILDKDAHYQLKYIGNEQWNLIENGKVTPNILNSSDLRMAIIFRARCYKSEKEKMDHNKVIKQETDLNIDKIKTKLIKDLRSRNRLSNEKSIAQWKLNKNALDLALKVPDLLGSTIILKHYKALPNH